MNRDTLKEAIELAETIKVFMGRLLLIMGDNLCEVELFNKDKKLKKGFGYIKGSLVYIYRGKLEKFKKSELEPGIYLDLQREYKFIEPSKDEARIYNVDNISELDLDIISESISQSEENFIQPEDIEVINNNAEVYIPTIKEDDDFLKVAVKKSIIGKEINLKNYKDRFSNQYGLNNAKSGLTKSTKMTVTNFQIWREILGLKWRLIIENDGTDKMNPLKEPIIIDSEDYK